MPSRSAHRARRSKDVSYFLDDGLLGRGRRLVDFVRSRGQHALIGDFPFHQRIPHPAFHEPPARRPVQMAGFWECAEYPEIGADELRREFTFRAPPDAENARVAAEITRIAERRCARARPRPDHARRDCTPARSGA